jgi:hypothetical protein
MACRFEERAIFPDPLALISIESALNQVYGIAP